MTTAIINPAAWINRFFDEVDRGWPQTRSAFAPAVDVAEDQDSYRLRAELPGVAKENLSVEVKENRLVLSGRKEAKTEKAEGRTHYAEASYGEFSRVFELPRNVRADAIEAEYKDGVLELRIPKVEESKPKTIPVK